VVLKRGFNVEELALGREDVEADGRSVLDGDDAEGRAVENVEIIDSSVGSDMNADVKGVSTGSVSVESMKPA